MKTTPLLAQGLTYKKLCIQTHLKQEFIFNGRDNKDTTTQKQMIAHVKPHPDGQREIHLLQEHLREVGRIADDHAQSAAQQGFGDTKTAMWTWSGSMRTPCISQPDHLKTPARD